MNQDRDTISSSESSGLAGRAAKKNRIYLVSYPKIVFMYPTAVAALVIGMWMHMKYGLQGVENVGQFSSLLTSSFLVLFTLNQVVISFDFPRTTSLTLFFSIFTLLLGGYLVVSHMPNMLPFLGNVFKGIKPVANAQFFYIVAAVYGLMFLMVNIFLQFDLCEVSQL